MEVLCLFMQARLLPPTEAGQETGMKAAAGTFLLFKKNPDLTFNPSIQEAEVGDLCEFQAS